MAFTVSERKTSSLIFDKVLNASLANLMKQILFYLQKMQKYEKHARFYSSYFVICQEEFAVVGVKGSIVVIGVWDCRGRCFKK